MFEIIKRILKIGIVTETERIVDLNTAADRTETKDDFAWCGDMCRKLIQAQFGGSLAIRHVDTGSCNGCELVVHALNNVFYNLERFGIHFVASPRHADVLLITGVVTRHMEEALRITYANTPEPKLVIASGNCAVSGGEFGENYASCGQVANVIPVDFYINGCPPSPSALLAGITQMLGNRSKSSGI